MIAALALVAAYVERYEEKDKKSGLVCQAKQQTCAQQMTLWTIRLMFSKFQLQT